MMTDPRPDWMRRCPPEEPLTDAELIGIARGVATAVLIVLAGLVGFWVWWRIS